MAKIKIVALCVLLSFLMALSGCTTMQAMDKAIADSIAKQNAANKAREQAPEAMQQPNNADQQEAQPAAAIQTVKIKKAFKSVNVRSEPSKQSSIVTTLPGGMEVAKVGETTGWVQVRIDMEDGSQIEGWISDETIEVEQ